MFRGGSSHSLDDKGRFVIPSRFREGLRAGGGDAVMITRMDGCLLAYSLIDWGKLENRILSLAAKSEAMRQFRRWFVGGAHECTFDKQGRVLIPPDLRGYAQLDKEIQTVGVLDHFEIWSQDKWAEEQERIHANMQQPEVRNEIAELGI